MVNSLARKWKLQVANVATPNVVPTTGWVNVGGLTSLTPTITPNNEDSSDFDTLGWTSVEPTMQSWTVEAAFNRLENANVYDPGQQLIQDALGLFGPQARVAVQWFDRNGGPEASNGIAIPTWKTGTSGYKNLESATVTFTGTDVPLADIENPFETALPPVVTGATPSGAGSAAAVAIYGANFTGSTVVKFGATAATSFTVVSDQLIVAVLPTASAGSAPITVTNPAGTSTSFAYTRAA